MPEGGRPRQAPLKAHCSCVCIQSVHSSGWCARQRSASCVQRDAGGRQATPGAAESALLLHRCRQYAGLNQEVNMGADWKAAFNTGHAGGRKPAPRAAARRTAPAFVSRVCTVEGDALDVSIDWQAAFNAGHAGRRQAAPHAAEGALLLRRHARFERQLRCSSAS